MDKKIDFDAPAFGNGNIISEKTLADVPLTEKGEEVEVKEPATLPAEGIVEQEVPYSRFSKVLERAKQAEREALEAQEQLEDLRHRREERDRYEPTLPTDVPDFKGSLPSYWVKLFGDSPESKEAYGYELARQRDIENRAEQRALEAVREERTSETKAIARNESIIDDRLDNLSGQLGRDLTEAEQSALLDIVDEYTPKDEDGNYAGDTIPFEKAWTIYEMQQQTQASTTKVRRTAATVATGSRSDGEPSGEAKRNENWNPLDWNSYRRRI